MNPGNRGNRPLTCTQASSMMDRCCWVSIEPQVRVPNLVAEQRHRHLRTWDFLDGLGQKRDGLQKSHLGWPPRKTAGIWIPTVDPSRRRGRATHLGLERGGAPRIEEGRQAASSPRGGGLKTVAAWREAALERKWTLPVTFPCGGGNI
jgi:hypothetical protein